MLDFYERIKREKEKEKKKKTSPPCDTNCDGNNGGECAKHANLHNCYYLASEEGKLVLHLTDQTVDRHDEEDEGIRVIRKGELKKEDRTCENGEKWQKLFRLESAATIISNDDDDDDDDDDSAAPSAAHESSSEMQHAPPPLTTPPPIPDVPATEFDYSTRWESRYISI